MRRRLTRRSTSAVVPALMFVGLMVALGHAEAAEAATGPSVPLPSVPSVAVSSPGMGSLPPDQAGGRELRGDQLAGAAPKDGGGTSAATSLSPSATWSVSAQSGDFHWSYPLRVPPAPGGLVPGLSLSYVSSAVDGRTSATNNQPSWVGDGWDLSLGFVERAYGACALDKEGGTTPPLTGDLCWRTDNAVATYNGGGGMLIRQSGAPDVWRARNDDGTRIERFTGAGNGDDNGESWRITIPDGTQYFYGSRPEAKSTWTVPVFGDDLGEPCNGSTFDASSCTQAWRWNLDKVVDARGNLMLLMYDAETNGYARNMKDTAVSYVRGGTLRRIEYGLHAAVPGQAAARVEFATADRCVPDAPCTLDKPGNWPDTPLASRCDTTTCRDRWSPTFWSTKRLSAVTTQVLRDGGYSDVDRWALEQSFPDPGDGDQATLWLKSISHTGLVGGSVTLPSVTFAGVQMANRVYQGDNLSPVIRYRIVGITSETGGVLSVNFAPPNCLPGSSMPANPESNTLRCFPVRWNRPGFGERTDWYHKYVVESVISSDRISSSLDQKVAYEYMDGAAWHFEMSEFAAPDMKTWSDFRGFGRVRIRSGRLPDPAGPITMTEQRFYRGMNGERMPNGGTRTVSVGDSDGGSRPDHDWLAGFGFESTVFLGDSTTVVSRSVTDPVWQGPTATRGDFTAYIVRPGIQRTFTALDGGRPRRETRTETTYDDRGLPVTVNDLSDVATAADDLCTRTTYVRNTAAWILSATSRIQTVSVHCGATPAFPANAVSDIRSWYDNQASGAAPTRGDVTRSQELDQHPVSGPVYTTVSTASYDIHGRLLETKDALDHASRIAYTPATGGPTTQMTATDAKGFTATTVLDPALGLPTKVTDANQRVTETSYDPLGRAVKVWLPDCPRESNQDAPSSSVAYLVRRDEPNVVTTSTVGANGRYVSSKTLYDGLLRPRQAQAPAAGGGRLLTDTRYDSQGRAYQSTQPFFNNAAVDDRLWEASDAQVSGQTRTAFDGAGRPIEAAFLARGQQQWRTLTTYGGDRVTVQPPTGGVPTTTVSDARGRTVERHQYRSPSAIGATDLARYAYTPVGQLATLTDPAGNTWRYTYDLHGRPVRADDPDKGLSVSTYDIAGRLTTRTDARGQTIVHEYDDLDRPLAVRAGSGTGRLLARWTYDTVRFGRGRPASATSYDDGGNAYTSTVQTYSALYRPTSTTVTIPPSEGPLAGTYTFRTLFNPDGSVASERYDERDGLGREEVYHVYDDFGRPLTTRGGLTGTVTYVSGTDYTRFGEVQRVQLGLAPKRVWLSTYFQDATRRVDRSIVDAELPRPMQSDIHYRYDPAGNVTAIADTPLDRPADTQCFRYDHLRRLVDAWTPNSDCTAGPSVTALTGPAPYWQSFGYDIVGNRLADIRHAAGGDTTRTYTYPAPGADRPHGVATVAAGDAGTSFGYDAAGNTTLRGAQLLTWNELGHLATVVDNGQTTSFVHGPDGQRFIRRDPASTTLYLGNQELKLDRATGAVAATRYYKHGGNTVAVRTAAGLTWLAGDHHGTAQIAVNTDAQTVTARRSDPFGNPRGTPPAAWPGEKGFVGGTADSSTGLTHLGAREYDPATGRFISVDPILDASDPQQFNAYAYANNNPSTFSDPTGRYCDSCEFYAATKGEASAWSNWTPPKPPLFGCLGPRVAGCNHGWPIYPSKPKPKPGCDGRRSCAHPSTNDDKPAPVIIPPPMAESGCDGRLRCAHPSRNDNAILISATGVPVSPRPSSNAPALPSQLGGGATSLLLEKLIEFNSDGFGSNPFIQSLIGVLAGDGGSVSFCGGPTVGYGVVASMEVCFAIDSHGIGMSGGIEQGAGPAGGVEVAGSVKVSTARIDQLGGREVYVSTGRFKGSVSADGHVSGSVSVPIRGSFEGNHVGHGESFSTYIFMFNDLWAPSYQPDENVCHWNTC